MANTYKVKRGMVFWYNLDERIDKNSRPTILVDGKEYPDHRQYGMRHWLVVSNDDGNNSSPTCTVVPITGANSKANLPSHATVTYRGRNFEVLCEQIMTVNIVSLKEYAYTLSDCNMNNVDKALTIQCSLSPASNSSSEIERRLLELEQRIENLISRYENFQKDIVDEYEKRLAALIQADDGHQAPVCRQQEEEKNISSKEIKSPVYSARSSATDKSGSRVPSNKHLSQIEKFNARYPDTVPEATLTPADSSIPAPLKERTSSNEHKWIQEMMQEYLNDTEALPPMRTAEKWGLKNIRTVYRMKYYIQNQLKCFTEAN